MHQPSRHLSTRIARTAAQVYDVAVDPANLPRWAAGLASSVEQVDGRWVAESPMGQVVVVFAPRNAFGVLDHEVTLPSGVTVLNPLRVIPDGDGCEVVFTLRAQPGVTADEMDRDEAAVLADLARLRAVVESLPDR